MALGDAGSRPHVVPASWRHNTHTLGLGLDAELPSWILIEEGDASSSGANLGCRIHSRVSPFAEGASIHHWKPDHGYRAQ